MTTVARPPDLPRDEPRVVPAAAVRLLPWAAFLVAALPLIVAALAVVVRRPAVYWAGDRALTELGVRAAIRGHQLVGIGGRFGWRHPGPMWLQLLVPFYELSGHAPWSLSVAAIAIHIAMIAVAIAVLARVCGAPGAAVLAAAVAVYLAATGLAYWTNLWAGYAVTWPLLALLALAALGSSAPHDAWALPGAVLVGTLLVQTDVSTAVIVVVVVATAVVLRILRAGRARAEVLRTVRLARTSPANPSASAAPAGANAGRRARGLVAAALLAALGAAAWAPPLVQQATHNPGNITLLVRFARSGAGGHPLRLAAASVGAALSVFALGARWVLHPGVQAHLGAGPWWAVAVAAVSVATSLAIAVVGWRRRRAFAADLALLTAVGIVAAVVSMSRVEGPLNFYLLMWATILPVTGATAAVLVLVPAAAGRARQLLTGGSLAVAAVVALITTGLHGTEQDWDRQASRDVAAQTALAQRGLGPSARGLVLVHVVTSDAWPYGAGVALQLQRHGARIEVDPGWVFLFGDEFAPTRSRPGGEVWFARPHEAPVLAGTPGLVHVGSVDGIDVYTRRD